MTRLKQLGLLAVACSLVPFYTSAQNQSNGTISTTISPAAPAPVAATEAFRFRAGLVTQLENSPLPATSTNLFGFTALDQWHSMGRVNGAAQTVTGFRAQRAGRGLLFGFDGALQGSTTPTLGDPIIQWGGNSALAPAVTPGDLLFRSFTSPTSAAPVIRFRMTGDGNSYAVNGLLGQISNGIFGVVNPSAQWMSSGRTDNGTISTTYSNRIVRGTRTFSMGYEGPFQTAAPTVGTPFLQWGNTAATLSEDLLFRNFDNLNFTTPVVRFRMTAGGNSFAEGGFIGQLSNGTFGDITGTAGQWISHGRVNGAAQTLYGSRIQRAGRALVTGFDGPLQTGATPTLGDAFIQWIGNNTSGVVPGNLDFRVADNPTSATPTQVLRLGSNGNAVLGTTALANDFNYGGIRMFVNGGPNECAIIGKLENSSIFSNTGVYGEVVNSAGEALGTVGNARLSTLNSSTATYGVYGNASGGEMSTGVWGDVSVSNSPIRYGVYGAATIATNSFAGYFAGNVIAAGGTYLPSDQKLKENIQPEVNTVSKIMQLNPVSYNYTRTASKELNMPDKFQHGFVAQEIEQLFPEMVTEAKAPVFEEGNKEGGRRKISRMETFKSINYTMLIPLLTKAIQEQQETIQSLQDDMAKMKASQVETKARATGYTLSQNVPNPFSSNTTISYTLPANASRAVLMVTNLNGTMLLQYNLAKGSGQQIINGNTLQAGIYIYSLIVDGNEIVSKRMVLTK